MHLINCNNITFCVFPAPTKKNIHEIISDIKLFNIKDIVYVTNIEYDISEFPDIQFHNLVFEDGGCPNEAILMKWFNLLQYFDKHEMHVGIHCKSSLGRAPLLIAIGMIYFGSHSEDAVLNIRNTIKNAINTKQILYLNKNEKNIKKNNKIKHKCNIL